MSYVGRGVHALNLLGRGARHFQSHAIKASQFSSRLGHHAHEFNKSSLGHHLIERTRLGGHIGAVSRGIEHHAPHASQFFQKAGDIAGKLKELENVKVEPKNKLV